MVISTDIFIWKCHFDVYNNSFFFHRQLPSCSPIVQPMFVRGGGELTCRLMGPRIFWHVTSVT